MILIDLIYSVKKDAQIVFLDTDLHFQETYDLIDRVQNATQNYILNLKTGFNFGRASITT